MRFPLADLMLLASSFVAAFGHPVADLAAGLNLNFSAPISAIAQDKNSIAIHQTKLITFAPTFPPSGRRFAVKEVESPVSQADTLYGRVQQFVASLYNPRPVVDTITEKEKYGNDGEPSRSVGTAVIGKFEGLSNILNAVVEAPFTAVMQFGKKASESLNTLGGKLVGLA